MLILTLDDLDYVVRDILSVDPDLDAEQVCARMKKQRYDVFLQMVQESFNRIWAQITEVL